MDMVYVFYRPNECYINLYLVTVGRKIQRPRDAHFSIKIINARKGSAITVL